MARIIGGVAASHTPTIGFAYDQHKQDDPSWAPIFKAFKPVEEWFKDKKQRAKGGKQKDPVLIEFELDPDVPLVKHIEQLWRLVNAQDR